MFDDNSGAKVIDIMNGSEGGDLSKSNIEDDKDLDEETLAGMIEAQKRKKNG